MSTVVGSLEDGHRPPADPDDWRCTYNIVTGQACPSCGTALAVALGPPPGVDAIARDIQPGYEAALLDACEHPVLVYCDRPNCEWYSITEWSQLQPRLESWLQRDAPTWRDRTRGGGSSR